MNAHEILPNGKGFMQFGNSEASVCSQLLLFEKLKLNLRTKVESCFSANNKKVHYCWLPLSLINNNACSEKWQLVTRGLKHCINLK